LLLPRTILAEEVTLPAPVIEWSFYILLIFAACVALGIFFLNKGNNVKNEKNEKNEKNVKNEFLSSLFDAQNQMIYSVRPNVSVSDSVRQMNVHRIGAMLVMVDTKLVGIFTERDALTKVLGAGLDPTVTNVSEVMTKNPFCVTPLTTLDEAMDIVTHKRFRHLPVVEDGKVVGMVSSGDLTHRLVRNQSGEIRELVEIAGRRGSPR